MIGVETLSLEDVARGSLAAGAAPPPLTCVVVQPGLLLSRTDLTLDKAVTIQAESFPVASLGVMFEGAISTEIEALREFAPGEALVLSNNETRVWTSRVGGRVRHVEICVTPDWFDSQERFIRDDSSFDALRVAMEHPLEVRRRALTPALRQLAIEAFAPVASGAAAALRLEARAIDLLAELAGVYQQSGPCCCRGRDLDRVFAIRREIERDPASVRTLTELAVRHGVSVSKMKRDFFAAFGSCVGGFVNEQRLTFGRRLIEDGMSVSQASYRAGYAHPSNFSTAFRRRFGVRPRDLGSRADRSASKFDRNA